MEKELKQSRTQKVLEKWGVEGNMNDEDIRNAASSFARIRVKNTIMKWVAVGGVLFIATFIGLMIGSVILGIEATKEFEVKQQELVLRNGTTIGTSEAFYGVNLRLTTPLSTIKGINSLKFSTKGGKGTLQFKVVSFFFIPSRSLIFYGVNHVAEVLPDGKVEVSSITSSANGKRSIDESKRDEYDQVSATGTEISTNTDGFIEINKCSDLLTIEETGKYQLTNSLECDLTQPLQPFSGIINGNGHYISANINYDGPVALFSALKQATIINLLLKGNITGIQNCGGLAVETYPGTKFISTGVYSNIECSNNGTKVTLIGAFSALLRSDVNNEDPIVWHNSVSQSYYTLALSNTSFESYQGGFYGAADEKVSTNFTGSYSAFTPYQHGNIRAHQFGFKLLVHVEGRIDKKDAMYDASMLYIPEDCYGYNKTSPSYINMCVIWYRAYLYEESCCCAPVFFDSCPYINCNPQSQVCMQCRITYGKNEEFPLLTEENQPRTSFHDDPAQFIPTTKNICEKKQN